MRVRRFPLCLIAAATLIAGPFGYAQQPQNGLMVTVGKTTLDRNDQRRGGFYSDRIDRVQGLKVVIKNTTFKPMPEGELRWQMLIRKYYGGTVESTSGTEKIKALRAAEAADLVVGAASVQGYKDTSEERKDTIEWQIIVRQGDKEIYKASSTPAFDALAKRARNVDSPTP